MAQPLGVPPGPLAAYLGVRNANMTSDEEGIGTLAKLLALKQAAEMRPLQMQVLQAKIKEEQQQAEARDRQSKATSDLSTLLTTGGYNPPPGAQPLTGVAMNDQSALQQVMAAEAAGQPANIGVPNPNRVRALALQAQPQQVIPELIKQEKPNPMAGVKSVPGGYIKVGEDGKMVFTRTQDERAPMSDVGKLNEDLRAGRITQEQFNAAMLGKGSGVGVIPEHQRDLHGADFLSTLPPGIGATVKGIAEGTVDIRSLSQRGGHREAMLERVTQFDPTFNMATYNTRLGVQKDFTSGVAARNVTAINTAIRHLGTLDTLGEALGNTDLRVQNAVVNRIALETGDPKVNNFDTAKSAVGNELMRVFRQVNASEQETKDWERKFSTASSPAQIKGAIKTGVELLDGRIKALDEQWQRGMNTDKGFPNLITPEAKRILDKIGGKAPAPAPGGWSIRPAP